MTDIHTAGDSSVRELSSAGWPKGLGADTGENGADDHVWTGGRRRREPGSLGSRTQRELTGDIKALPGGRQPLRHRLGAGLTESPQPTCTQTPQGRDLPRGVTARHGG